VVEAIFYISFHIWLLHLLTPPAESLGSNICARKKFEAKETTTMKRMLFAAVATIALTAAVFAQRGPGGPRGGNPITSLKDALSLTDAQVTAITALFQAEQTRTEAIRAEIEQRRQALDATLNVASPAPVDVGNAAIALHASEAKIKAEQDSFIAQLKQQLTGDQQQKLDTLLAANGGRLLPGLGGPGGAGRGARGPRPGRNSPLFDRNQLHS
jgi:Spy/CpxP family protein refolding chaperone